MPQPLRGGVAACPAQVVRRRRSAAEGGWAGEAGDGHDSPPSRGAQPGPAEVAQLASHHGQMPREMSVAGLLEAVPLKSCHCPAWQILTFSRSPFVPAGQRAHTGGGASLVVRGRAQCSVPPPALVGLVRPHRGSQLEQVGGSAGGSALSGPSRARQLVAAAAAGEVAQPTNWTSNHAATRGRKAVGRGPSCSSRD